jgi:flagellar basal-body rod modification protein FlgD
MSSISPLTYATSSLLDDTKKSSTTGTTSTTSTDDSSDDTSSTTDSTSSLTSEGTFLTLLVAQLKNQNPLDPADGTEFVTELAQFSQLESTTNIESDVSTISDAITSTSTSA